MRRWDYVGICCFIAICSCGFLYWRNANARPLFSNWPGKGEVISGWYPGIGIPDAVGTYTFADFQRNLLVVVVTDDLTRDLNWEASNATEISATLLLGSKYETVVHATDNALLIIRPNVFDDRMLLPPEQAQQWYYEFLKRRGDPTLNVLGEILRRLENQSDKTRLARILETQVGADREKR